MGLWRWAPIGCEFYGFDVDVDGSGVFDHEPDGFVVINSLLLRANQSAVRADVCRV
jgi:hypothetical protein